MAEAALPGYSVMSWYGSLAPAGTPHDIVTRLNTETGNAMRALDMKERIAAEAANPMAGTTAEFAGLLKTEIAKWAAEVKQSGMTPE